MLFIVLSGIFVGLMIFIYFNRYLQQRRESRREEMLERKEEFLQRLLEMKKKQHKGPDDEVSDTTKAE